MLIIKRLMLIFALLALSAGIVTAQRGEQFRGLNGVGVKVQVLNENPANDAGLNELVVKSEVEVQLRTAGITIQDDSLVDGVVNAGRLLIQIRAIKIADDYYVCYIEIALREPAALARSPKQYVTAETFGLSQMITAQQGLRKARDSVRDMVTIFANDYLAANPPKKR